MWRPPQEDGGSPIEHYVIERKPAGHYSWLRLGTTDTEHFATDRLRPGDAYHLRVTPVNAQGRGAPLLTTYAIVVPRPPSLPSAPVGPLRVDTPESDFLTLSWGRPRIVSPEQRITYVIEGRSVPRGPGLPPVTWQKLCNVAGEHLSVSLPRALFDSAEPFQFRVRAVSDLGAGPELESSPIVLADKWTLPAPRGPLVSRVDYSGDVSLAWQPLKEAKDFIIQKRVEPTGAWKTISVMPASAGGYLDIRPQDDLVYRYRVAGRDHRGIGLFLESEDVCVRPQQRTIGFVPTVLDFSARPLRLEEMGSEEGAVVLTWKRPEFPQPLTYHIEVWEPTRKRWISHKRLEGSDTELVLRELDEHKQYFYRITTCSAHGLSQPVLLTRPIVRPQVNKPPDTPLGFVVDHDKKGHFRCSWIRPLSDGGSPITEYIIELFNEIKNTWVYHLSVKPWAVDCVIDNLICGFCYSLRIIAINKNGRSDPSLAPVVYLPRPVQPPRGIPGFLDVEDVHDQGLMLRLRELRDELHQRELELDDEISALRLDVWMSGRKGWTELDYLAPSTREYVLPSLTNAELYKFRLVPMRDNLSGPPLVSREFRPQPTDYPPSAPTAPFTAARQSATSLIMRWAEPRDIGSSPLTGYVVEKRSLGRREWFTVAEVGPSDPTCSMRFRPDEEPFFLRVRAKNKQGAGEPLDCDTKIVPEKASGPPGPPVDFKAIHVGPTNVLLRWNPPITKDTGPVRSYTIELLDAESLWRPVAVLPSTIFIFELTGLVPNTPYEFRLSAGNDAGQSDPAPLESALRTLRLPEAPRLPPAPGVLEAVRLDSRSVQLEWRAPPDTGDLEYIVERRMARGDWMRVGMTPMSDTSLKVGSLRESTPYHFRVFAVNEAGRSRPSVVDEPVVLRGDKGEDKLFSFFVVGCFILEFNES